MLDEMSAVMVLMNLFSLHVEDAFRVGGTRADRHSTAALPHGKSSSHIHHVT